MGGKGARRREKNFEAAHGGGHTRLPPPPDPSAFDALPSKLRKLMSFAESASAKKGVKSSTDKETPSGEGHNSTSATGTKRKRNDQNVMTEKMKFGHDASQNSPHDKKKKKKKRKAVVDHRFDEKEDPAPVGTQRKERKKQRLEARKKKSKKARADAEADLGFRGHEDIKFGDVVQAPPKLVVPKAFKTNQVASQERLRLQAVEAYRQRKGWTSRPGGQLPAAPVTDSSL